MTPEEIKLRRQYKNVFSTGEGREVLKDLLFNQLGTFSSEKQTESDISLSNVGMNILGLIGCTDINKTADAILNSVLGVPVTIDD